MAAAVALLKGETDVAEIQASAQAFGLRFATPEPAVCEVWEEHWPALRVFGAMQTQWQYSFAGCVGLNYTALPVVAAALGYSPEQASEAFAHVQVLERHALEMFRDSKVH